MSNELLVIEEATALSVLTSVDQVNLIIADVQEKVNSLDGGTMDTDAGRKKIISNAFKAKRSKTYLNGVIVDLIQQQKDSIDNKTKDEQAAIASLKDNKTRLDEIARQEQIKADEKKQADAREANRAHVGEVRRLAKEAFIAAGLDEESAKKAVLAISKNSIPAVTIKY